MTTARVCEPGPKMGSGQTDPVARFRLYPEAPCGLYVLVTVWPSRDLLHQNCSCVGNGAHEGCCSGVTIEQYGEGGYERTLPLCAEVHLHTDAIGTGVLTHELFHATMAWGRRIGFDWSRLGADDSVNDDEERLAYAHGKLCHDFVARAIRAGLYE